MDAFSQGILLGLALIVAIGAQNVFIIREGLRGGYVYTAAFVSASCDAILIMIGIFLISAVAARYDGVEVIFIIFAILFLTLYALGLIRNAFKKNYQGWAESSIELHDGKAKRRNVVRIALFFSFLSPHVYVDTVIVLGGVGSTFEGLERYYFGIGGAMASYIWFYITGFLANRLSIFFKNEKNCRILDFFIGIFVFSFAIYLTYDLIFFRSEQVFNLYEIFV